MTNGTTEHVTDEPVKQIIAQQETCVASGTGPDGSIDGILVFGPPGLVEVTNEQLCRFPLRAIEEGSPLRSWLRISRHSGEPVPWAMLFVDRKAGASVLLVGTARLVPGEESPDMERSVALMIEITPHHVTYETSLSIPVEVPSQSSPTAFGTGDGALRAMAAKPAKEMTDPVRIFLERGIESFLCSIDQDRCPQIRYIVAAPGTTLMHGPDLALDQQSIYAHVDGEIEFGEQGDASRSPGALLIVPNFHSQLAVRVAGTTHMPDVSDAPPTIRDALIGASRLLEIAAVRVEVQAGNWSAAREPAEQAGNLRVDESVLRVHGERSIGRAEVSFAGGPIVLARGGESLLELAEANGVRLESGCRMGICGADPVRIDAGVENLSPVRRSEQSTLDRMGLPPGCRMACSARVQGPVEVTPVADITAEQLGDSGHPPATAGFPLDPEVRRVVVIGTGIAGITAVEEVRKLHPEAEIAVVGAERYDFYNRMAISRLVDEDTSPDRLSLMSPDWARRRRVLYLPGVSVSAIDRRLRQVIPAEGVTLPYDRLVLAMGARSNIPSIEGVELPGVFALRTIDDALAVREHARRSGPRRAVVIGGGLLGLEAAYHLAQAGLRVWIVGRGDWPANRQLDEHAGGILAQMLQDLGIAYVSNAEPRRLVGDQKVEGIELLDGRVLPADLCLAAAGIVPNADLARAADLEVVHGVVVDDHMRTSDPAIYAAGDAIEYRGRTFGLWPASVDQAVVAATNLLGGDLPYHATMAPAQLKVPGIDLLSVGEIAPRGPEEREIRSADRNARRYRKLILRQGRAIGAIVIGSPALFDGIADAVQTGRDLSAELNTIERGDWSTLASDEEGADVAVPVVSGMV